MVLEVTTIAVLDDVEEAFEEAFADARLLVASTEGFHSIRLFRGIEHPNRYVLLAGWESVDAHDEFRHSERFVEWRRLLGRYFSGSPEVRHYNVVSDLVRHQPEQEGKP